jgi:hypothetical protein
MKMVYATEEEMIGMAFPFRQLAFAWMLWLVLWMLWLWMLWYDICLCLSLCMAAWITWIVDLLWHDITQELLRLRPWF